MRPFKAGKYGALAKHLHYQPEYLPRWVIYPLKQSVLALQRHLNVHMKNVNCFTND